MKRRILYITACTLLTLFVAAGCGPQGNDGHHHDGEHGHHHDGEGEQSEVEVSEAQMEAVGITLGVMERRAITETISATGRLEVGPDREADVSPRLSGIITRICVAEGQHVGRGTIIAYIEAPEVASLRESYLTAQADVKLAKAEVERQEALAAAGAGIRKNLEAARSALSVSEIRLQAAREILAQYGVDASGNGNTIPVRSGIAGVVTQIPAVTGAFADMQSPIAKVVDTNGIYCIIRVFEKDLPAIKKGGEVDMMLTNNQSVTFSGKVLDVNPTLGEDTNTIPVKVSVDYADKGSLIPGMGVTASVLTADKEATSLPENAVVSSGGKSFIFCLEGVEKENGELKYHFRKVEVVCGASSMGYVAVTPLTPVNEDTKIVTDNAFFLNSMASDHGEHSH